MSNTAHTSRSEKTEQGSSILFVVVLLVVVASVLAFIAFHSSNPRPSAQPSTHAVPAQSPSH